MPEVPNKFFLTTPIYYVNARPHIGHAYTTIVGDVLARRSRAQGTDTWFLTGTDEHGQKIERSAQAADIPPQEFTDQVSAEFRALWQRMGITNDDFIRTTEPRHKRGAQKLFADLHAAGHIYLSTYTGQYSIGEEMFVEGPPGTIGPDGRPTETVTEENFFFRLSNFQLPLIDLIESDTLKIRPASSRNEVLGFLRGNVSQFVILSEARSAESKDPEAARPSPADRPTPLQTPDDLEPTGPTDIPINPHAEPEPTESAPPTLLYSAAGTPYLPGALRDLSVSRSSFTWGIPVPEPAASEAKEKHVIYVWLDALANYMTALGYGSEAPEDQAKFKKYWPANLHLVGKEITRFHCVYWPAFLLAAGLEIPKEIVANGWLLFDNSKMSKSKGNIVRTETILDAFGTLCPPPVAAPFSGISSGLQPADHGTPKEGALAPANSTPHQRDLFAADVLRYYLLREIPFGQDGSFSFEALITRYNADLANGYGNLVSRTLKLISNSFESIPSVSKPLQILGLNTTLSDGSAGVVFGTNEVVGSMRLAIPECERWYRENSAAVYIAKLVALVDGYLSSTTPWKLKDESERVRLVEVLYTAAESIRIITALLYPILPYATAAVWAQLGLGSIEQAAARGDLKNLTWGGLKPGTKLGPLAPIFPRVDKGLAKIMTDMESQKDLQTIPSQEDATTPLQSEIASEAGAPRLAPETWDPTHPAAPPRTSSLAEPNPGQQVAASVAHTTERQGTPSHTEAASGIFAPRTDGAPFIPEPHPGMSGSTSESSPATGPADASPQISIDDFAKIELRVAQILVCERIPKADKLLRLEVDLGYEKRQILSGIAEWYTPEELIGRRIVVITNLAPRKMRGLESHGMLLAASTDGGKPHLATFTGTDSDALPLGSRLK